VHRLGILSRELDKQTSDAERLDLAAITARHAYEVAYSRAFLSTTGAEYTRKHYSVLETEGEKLAAEIAEQQLRACRTRIGTLKVQVDTGRSLSAALRAEAALAGAAYAT
jgi:hypothetical protein